MTVDIAPRNIRLETPHYIVRTLEPADATDAWRDWLTDPVAARNLNARPERLTAEALDKYIAAFNRATTHLLGIFEKETQNLIGVRAVYIDAKTREFLVNVLIGETQARNKGARGETRTVMYRYFFEEMNLETARMSVVEGNTAILKVAAENGWIHERTSQKPNVHGQGHVTLHHYRLPREVWRRKERERTA
jgi:RimJ/RimL family protein N-acetyltransferase